MKLNPRIKGILLVLISTMLWGVSGTAAQYLFQNQKFSTEWLVVIRLLISGSALLIMSLIKDRKNTTTIWTVKSDRRKLLVFSIIGMLGVQYTYFAAIKHGNAATATILQYLSPIIISCYLIVKNKKLPGITQLTAIILAMTGTFFIITKGSFNSLALSKMAIFWGITSAVCSAIYTIQPVSLLKKYGSLTVVGWGMLCGGLAFSILHAPWNFSGTVSLFSIMLVAFIIIFGTLIAFCCYLESLNYLIPTETSILGCMEPLSAAVLSVMLLNTHFNFVEILGMIFIITTVIILSFSKEK